MSQDLESQTTKSQPGVLSTQPDVATSTGPATDQIITPEENIDKKEDAEPEGEAGDEEPPVWTGGLPRAQLKPNVKGGSTIKKPPKKDGDEGQEA
ncbi:hypothetical protein NLJ89_g933 [Agrocybe chaxingu]|uniref:Uncharacterized protein n=1 Tax=Agrocybe chaxingu TaxID=84603 RepID=A0A9W8TF96_9AGAR|nr:hypothetical protein NLJ89_g933 [Agrocybe chaxingu]